MRAVRWEIATMRVNQHFGYDKHMMELKVYLDDGWEPYTVTEEHVPADRMCSEYTITTYHLRRPIGVVENR